MNSGKKTSLPKYFSTPAKQIDLGKRMLMRHALRHLKQRIQLLMILRIRVIHVHRMAKAILLIISLLKNVFLLDNCMSDINTAVCRREFNFSVLDTYCTKSAFSAEEATEVISILSLCV